MQAFIPLCILRRPLSEHPLHQFLILLSSRRPRHHLIAQRLTQRFIFTLFDSPQFFPSFRRFVILRCCSRLSLGVPAEVFALLPPSYRSEKTVSKVSLPVRGAFDVVPGECIPATARARFADGRYEVHCSSRGWGEGTRISQNVQR